MSWRAANDDVIAPLVEGMRTTNAVMCLTGPNFHDSKQHITPDQGEQVNHPEHTAKRPALSNGFFATLSNLFGGRGTGAPAGRSPLRFALLTAVTSAFLLVPAAQALAAQTLDVTLAGTGSGKVTSGDTFIECSNISGSEASACGHDYSGFFGSVTLIATPAPDSTFAGWTSTGQVSGTCTGGATTNPCTTGLVINLVLTATFTVNLPPPVVTIDPVATTPTAPCTTAITARSACFSGTVDPDGNDTHWHFEYRPVGEAEWIKFPDPDADAGDGTDPVTVQATPTDLIPNTNYEVRLVASNASKTVNTDPPETFTTLAIPPDVLSTSAAPGSTTATLFAGVNPNKQNTSYHFEYGPTESYGSSIPVPDGSAGAGFVPTQVVAVAGGLAPETTYHYRVVAMNATGTIEGPDRNFTTSELPPTRGYELVTSEASVYDAMTSPLVTEFHSGWNNQALVSTSSGKVLWEDRGTGPNPAATNGFRNAYTSSRDPQRGWSGAAPVFPSAAGAGPAIHYVAASRDLTSFVAIASTYDPDTGVASTGGLLYRAADGSTATISDQLPNPNGDNATVHLSPDGTHAFFVAQNRLLPEDTHGPLNVDGDPASHQVYEWTEEGGLKLAGVESNGEQTSPCGAMLAGVSGTTGDISKQDISDNGSRVLFNSPDPSLGASGAPGECKFGGPSGTNYVPDLYLRDGSTTTNISKPPAGTPDYGAAFVGATSDLSQIFFVTGTALPDDAPSTPDKTTSGIDHADLYRYDAVSGDLTRLSVGPAGNDDAAAQGGAGSLTLNNFLNNLRASALVSADGTHVYFTGRGQLVPGQGSSFAENQSDGTVNLYLWNAGESVSYIATLLPPLGISGAEKPLTLSTAAITPDGSDLVFGSASRLTDFDNEGARELYRYDETADRIECITCAPDGTPPSGSIQGPQFRSSFNSAFGISPYATQWGGLSNDGKTVVFASTEKLLPGAVNATPSPTSRFYNVYLWHDGDLSLLSTGKSLSSDFLIGMSADGTDAYFLTASQLAPADGDSAYDIYDARIGGGFPVPPAPGLCEGEACRGAGTGAPTGAGAGTAAFQGPGNKVEPPHRNCRRISHARKLNRAARKLRRRAKRAGSAKQALRLRRRAQKIGKRAKRDAKKAKRCRRAKRRTAQ